MHNISKNLNKKQNDLGVIATHLQYEDFQTVKNTSEKQNLKLFNFIKDNAKK